MSEEKIAKPWEPWYNSTEVRLGGLGKVLASVDPRVDPIEANALGQPLQYPQGFPSIPEAKLAADKELHKQGYQLMNCMYAYPRRANTVDAVVFGVDEDKLKILLVLRKDENQPFVGMWALPGGFLDESLRETTDQAVVRKLGKETSLREATGGESPYLEQLYTFSDPDRDPREPVLSVAYYALVKPSNMVIKAGSDTSDVKWFDVVKLPKLAFDHAKIIKMGRTRLEGKVRYQPVGFELLPPKFTLSQLQTMYEAILQRPLDKRNFRKKIKAMGILEELPEKVSTEGRQAHLYRFNRTEYKRLVKGGFNFEI